MNYILYKYRENTRGRVMLYVSKIEQGQVHFTAQSYEAKKFNLLKAIIFSLRFNLSWIHRKFINRK